LEGKYGSKVLKIKVVHLTLQYLSGQMTPEAPD
jgi:hypothetical protein